MQMLTLYAFSWLCISDVLQIFYTGDKIVWEKDYNSRIRMWKLFIESPNCWHLLQSIIVDLFIVEFIIYS
jgi:hypothetical protein